MALGLHPERPTLRNEPGKRMLVLTMLTLALCLWLEDWSHRGRLACRVTVRIRDRACLHPNSPSNCSLPVLLLLRLRVRTAPPARLSTTLAPTHRLVLPVG